MNKFENISFTYFKPTQNFLHSKDLLSTYQYFIKETNNNILCINNWCFLREEMFKNQINKGINFEKNIIFLNDDYYLIKYEVRNSGHSILNMLHQIFYYLDNNLKCKILIPYELFNFSLFCKSLINLFLNKDDIIIINLNETYLINKLYFSQQSYINYTDLFSIYEKNIIDDKNLGYVYYKDFFYTNHFEERIINSIKNKINAKTNFLTTYDNICLIKTKDNINSEHMDVNFSISRSFNNEYIDYLVGKKFFIVDPGNYDILDLFLLLNNAKNIVLSWGAISYLNKIIICNKNINYVLLTHKDYVHEFKFISINNMIPSCKNCFIIYNLETSLNKESEIILDKIMDSLS
jgi:hypothetical protein